MTKKNLSQDEMIKNLLRDYPEDALDFFYPEVLKKYGKITGIDFHVQEAKKHSHYDKNLKNDLIIIYKFDNGKNVLLTLIDHWSDKHKFDIHRFAKYLIDLDFQFPGYEKLPIALFTDKAEKWRKIPHQKIEIKCLDEVFLTFKYRLIRMKSYEAEHYTNTKNRFIAVLRSAMKWDFKNKVMLAIELFKSYESIEKNLKILIKNIEIIDYYLYLDNLERDDILKILERGNSMRASIVEELKKKGRIEGKLEGKIEGIWDGKLETAAKMIEKGFSIEDILDITGLSKEDLIKEKII